MRVYLLCFLAIVWACPALGGISAGYSYLHYSRDGTKVLVMRSLTPSSDADFTLPDGTTINIPERFAKSGVYDAATYAPLWQFDWYCLDYSLLYSEDLEHVIRVNIHGLKSAWAMEIYKKGRLLRTYDCNQLLTGLQHPRLVPYSTWDWHSVWYGSARLSPDQTKLFLSTARREVYLCGYRIDLGLQEFYVFDLDTGDMLSQRIEGRWVIWTYFLSTLAFCSLWIVFLRMLWRRLTRTAPPETTQSNAG